jgi:alpha-L-rhamnosidase
MLFVTCLLLGLLTGPREGCAQWLTGFPLMEALVPSMNRNSSAILNVSGLGWSYVTINGVRVDATRRLDPGWTYYSSVAYYSTYNVTEILRSLQPPALDSQSDDDWLSIRVYLSGGHYASNWYSGQGETLLYLELAFDAIVVLSTNAANRWRCSEMTPYTASSVYGGEIFDARLINTSDQKWRPCSPANASKVPQAITEQTFPPIREHEHLPPIFSWRVEGISLFDFGQNIAGVLRVGISGCPTGTEIILQHAELLWPNKTLNTINLGMANATDVLIVSGADVFVYQPEFTYHGFQYASVTGPSCLVIESIAAVVIQTVAPSRGNFTTTDQVLQGIHRLTVWSQRANLMSIPTDCPQRDERLGWLADAQLSSEEANINFDVLELYKAFTRHNMAVALNQQKQISDFVPDCDAENNNVTTKCNRDYTRPADPAWGAAFLLIPYNTYINRGDSSILRDNYKEFSEYVVSLSALVNADGLLDFGDFGDWEALSTVDTPLVSTQYLYRLQRTLSLIAAALGMQEDEEHWSAAANYTRVAFNTAFLDVESCEYRTSFGHQAANALPLYAGLVPAEQVACVAASLEKYILDGDVCEQNASVRCNPGHLSVGIIGAQALLPALSANGYHRLAVEVARTVTFPSWGFMVAQNATTLWEQWTNTYLPSDGASHNHVMFGSIDVWLYEYFAGLKADGTVDVTLLCDSMPREEEAAVGYEIGADRVVALDSSRLNHVVSVRHIFTEMGWTTTVHGAVHVRHNRSHQFLHRDVVGGLVTVHTKCD